MKTIRCGIYTRKSTEEGLQQEFNSLDAQREASEAFIASQKAEGWRCLPETYDDGGFSGGNLERPAMKRLIDDNVDRLVDGTARRSLGNGDQPHLGCRLISRLHRNDSIGRSDQVTLQGPITSGYVAKKWRL